MLLRRSLQPGAIGAEAEFAVPQRQVLAGIIPGDVCRVTSA